MRLVPIGVRVVRSRGCIVVYGVIDVDGVRAIGILVLLIGELRMSWFVRGALSRHVINSGGSQLRLDAIRHE